MKITVLPILILSSLIWTAQPAVASDSKKVKPSPSLPSMTAKKSDYLPLLKRLKDEVRQGNDASAKSIIKQLGAVRGAANAEEKSELSQTADFLIGKEKWDLAKLYLEQLPMAEPGWGYVLIKHMCSECKNDATALDAIDNWIKARYPFNEEYWWRLRMTFAEEAGRRKQILADFAKQVKDKPDDVRRLKWFILASDDSAEKSDIHWICEVVQPKLAYRNYQVAEWLHMRHPAEAIFYLKRAQTIPFSPQDEEEIKNFLLRYSALPANLSSVPQVKHFSVWVRSMLAECYQKVGQSKEAQSILLQLSKESGGQVPTYALSQLAGQIQAATPTRPLEQQIKAAEVKNEDSIDYWRGRADYYRGRKETEQERSAWLRALKLAKSKQANLKQDQSAQFYLPMIVSSYALFLRRHESEQAAIKFIWSEFDAASKPNSSFSSSLEYRTKLVRDLEQTYETDQTGYLSPVDERLWQMLKQANTWSYTEERILWRMARNAKPEQRQQLWKRAEGLALGNASRELTLGWILNRCQEAKRSIPLLLAASKSNDKDLKQRSQFTLFESYLDVFDWRRAEEIWPAASLRLTSEEKPDWLSRIAVAAARVGDKDNSLRLWQVKDSIDLSALNNLDEMIKYGMKDKLINYYRELKKSKPKSTVPDEALRKLVG
ncbi:MAG: hypothetical protein Q8T09_13730 [Candidatus Melainabacteria bacterium]|nr:hypothetical protein [Candidatus Melainabacteria bacterium]